MDTIKREFAPLVFFFILACTLTYPAIFNLRGHTIGEAHRSTVRQEIYQQWNMLHHLHEGDLLHYYRMDLINHPYGQDVSENMGISLNLYGYLPLAPFLDLFGRANLLVIFFLTLNGFFMFRLGRRISDDAWIGLACGFFFVFCPYLFLKLNQGFHQKVILFWLPLFWSAILSIRENGKIKDGLLAGLWYALMLYSYSQYAYYTMLFTGFYFLIVLIRQDRLTNHIKGFVPMAGVIVVAVLILFSVVHETEPLYQQSWRKPLDDLVYLVGYFDITHPFRYFPYTNHWSRIIPYPLGITITLPVLALLGTILYWKRGSRFYLAGALLFILIAMGGRIVIGGDRFLTILGHEIYLPYHFLINDLPFGYRLGHSIRALPIAIFCLIILSAFALKELSNRLKILPIFLVLPICVLYMAENLLLLPELFPPKVEKADIPRLYQQIAEEDGEAILNLPLIRIKSDYIYFSAISGKKLVNHYLVPRRKVSPEKSFVLRFPKPEDSAKVKCRYLCELAQAGVYHIIVHPPFILEQADQSGDRLIRFEAFLGQKPITSQKQIDWLKEWLGPPEEYDDDRFHLYRLPKEPAFCLDAQCN